LFCVGVMTGNIAFLQTDNEVLRAEDPHAQRVLRGVWRAARLSERIHAEGIGDGENNIYIYIYILDLRNVTVYEMFPLLLLLGRKIKSVCHYVCVCRYVVHVEISVFSSLFVYIYIYIYTYIYICICSRLCAPGSCASSPSTRWVSCPERQRKWPPEQRWQHNNNTYNMWLNSDYLYLFLRRKA